MFIQTNSTISYILPFVFVHQ